MFSNVLCLIVTGLVDNVLCLFETRRVPSVLFVQTYHQKVFLISINYMSSDARKTVFGVSDQF